MLEQQGLLLDPTVTQWRNDVSNARILFLNCLESLWGQREFPNTENGAVNACLKYLCVPIPTFVAPCPDCIHRRDFGKLIYT